MLVPLCEESEPEKRKDEEEERNVHGCDESAHVIAWVESSRSHLQHDSPRMTAEFAPGYGGHQLVHKQYRFA